MRRQHDPRSGALLRSRPDAPGVVAERVAYRLAGERAIREITIGAAKGRAEVGEALMLQQKRHAELAREYAAKVAHIRGTDRQAAEEAELVLREAEKERPRARGEPVIPGAVCATEDSL